MTDAQRRIERLIQSILSYFEAHRQEAPGVALMLDKLEAMNLSAASLVGASPQGTRHDAVLSEAIEGVSAPDLAEIAGALAAAKDDLIWREDDARYYAADADLGDGYRRCNLHTVLIGPEACGYEQPDFCLGLFMLGPRILYRDHRHAAPEVYLNLSERTGWRFKAGGWQDYEAGSIIWNPPGVPHATRVYDRPFLSVFVWLDNIQSPCEVIPCADWVEIEAALAGGRGRGLTR